MIPRESLGLEISYQMVISDIFNLLRALRTEVSRAASMTISKADPKAKRPHGGSQGKVPSNNGKTIHTNVPMAMPVAPVWPLTHPSQIMSVEDSPDGEGSFEPDPPPFTCDFVMEGAPLPSTKGVRPWADRHVGKEADCVGNALLLPTDMENWKIMEREGMLLALKRNVVLVGIN